MIALRTLVIGFCVEGVFFSCRKQEHFKVPIIRKIQEENMSKELAKTYDPKGIEDRLYKKWMDNGYFHAKVNPDKKPFTIVMPPPNVTGQLHMGHALDETMQDILIRFKRMQGYEALWQPGTDHAAIATEVKVTEKLRKEGIDKNEIGRDEFMKHAWAWKEEYGGKIINQLKKLGASADWERERFTMDEGCSKAVQEVFIRLYEKGYIYKGSRIINWCPVCQTSISDAEVVHEDQDGFFWHINYPIVGEEGRFVEIATTRPETLLGDTAVAVNPEDERYKDLVGKMLKLPLTDREIPVIADEYVDKEFGTGCVKITPAHDPNDFEVGRRHNLEEINILNDDATINSLGGKYAGMDRYEARKAMVADLEAQGLHRYEIANYAVSGQYSSHNLVYWHYLPYLSFGSSACSFNGSQRFTATDSVTDYIESIQSGKSCGGFEDLTKEMQLSEYLFMGLRTTVGIDLIETEQRFGCDVMLEFGVELEKFIRGNLVFCDIEHRRMRLTEQGMRFSNEIFEIFVK